MDIIAVAVVFILLCAMFRLYDYFKKPRLNKNQKDAEVRKVRRLRFKRKMKYNSKSVLNKIV